MVYGIWLIHGGLHPETFGWNSGAPHQCQPSSGHHGWGPLNKGAGDWNSFDVWLRQELEYTHCSWLTVRPDLEAKAYRGVGSQSTPFRDNKQKSSSILKGYCFEFHTRGTQCQCDQCPMTKDASSVARSTQGTPGAIEAPKHTTGSSTTVPPTQTPQQLPTLQ